MVLMCFVLLNWLYMFAYLYSENVINILHYCMFPLSIQPRMILFIKIYQLNLRSLSPHLGNLSHSRAKVTD